MKQIIAPLLFKKSSNHTSLFLAGGITNTFNWQPQMAELLKNTNLTLLNPRRKDFDVTNKNIEKEQIVWEFKHLQKADAIMFWFPCETLCPITLYELGKWVVSDKKLFIGHHPDYKRKRDIEIQVGLVRKKQNIHDSLEKVAKEIIDWSKK